MSDFGLFEADVDAQQAPQRQARVAATRLATAVQNVRDDYGPFLMGSTGKDEFEDRWHHAKADIRKTIEAAGAFPNTGVMRRVHNAMKREFVATLGEDNSDDPTKKPKDDGDGDSRTISDSQYKKVQDGDKSVTDEVETNTGDGSDAEGKNKDPNVPKHKDPRHAARQLLAEDFDDGDLIPEGNFDAYLDSVDQGGPEKVERNFSEGGDTGTHREARRLAVELYKDFASDNGLRVAKLSTLNHYADTGIDDSTYFMLANLIRQADENCDCDDDDSSDSHDSESSSGSDDKDTDGPEGSDTDSDGPPSGAAEKGGESESDDTESNDGDSSDSDSGGSSENPFSDGGEDGPPSDAPEEAPGPPADDAGPAGDPEAPPGPPDLGPEDGGDPAGPPPGDPQAPPGPPDLSDAPPLAQDDFSGVEEYAPDAAGALPPDTELVAVEQIEDALGLPPGTLEQILMESAGGAPQGPSSGPGGPPPHMGRRKQSFGEQPAAAAPAPAAPAAPGAAPDPSAPPAAPTTPGVDNGALLDQAGQAVTQLVDQKTQEYQMIIDPLQQAVQAIEFARSVEQAANPLDVTPPEGTVDVSPQSAVDPAAAASQQAGMAPPAPAAPAAPAGGGESSGGGSDSGSSEKKEASRQLALAGHALKIARHYDLSVNGYNMLLEAMSRKHYQHVAEAIQSLPPEHRMGIAASLADMFGQDNVRFNAGQFMASAGVPMGVDAVHMGSRHPFASNTTRTGGETWKPPSGGDSMDAFEFPGHSEKPQFSDNMDVNDLPKAKTSGVVEDYQRYDKRRGEQGLDIGGEGEVDQFLQNKKVGPRAQDKLHETLGLEPHPKTASVFQPKVAGWEFDDHLNGYVSHIRQAFHCPCGQSHLPPSHGMCRCGKLWYTYAIGTGQHLASGEEAQMFLAREIPVRENVIMANRQFEADTEESNNESGDGPFQDYAEDIDFFADDELDSAPTPHAPGETDMETSKTASFGHWPYADQGAQQGAFSRIGADYGDDDHNVVTRNGEKFCSACDAMLWDPNVHHCPQKQASRDFFADWTVYSDDDNKGYEEGPKEPPVTTPGKQPPKDWAKRDDKGNWVKPQFK
jgi:hypothetical protein